MPLPAETGPGISVPVPAHANEQTLAGFVLRNHTELMARCREKAALRCAPDPPLPPATSGVPRFLQQLAAVLESEQRGSSDEKSLPPSAIGTTEIGQTAAVHGAALLQQGFSVDQVVHEYGDICQAVTELALAQNIPLSTDEFRVLNRCLDNAIADAVAAYQRVAQQTMVDEQASGHLKLQMLIHDQQRLVGIARHSFLAIKSGHVGITGATSMLLAHALEELLHLSEKRLPRAADVLRQVAECQAGSN